jgi:hypothetical protein
MKQFCADLTKYILSSAIPAYFGYTNVDPVSGNFQQMNPTQRPIIFNYSFNSKPISTNINNNDILMLKLNEINEILEKLSNKSDRITEMMEVIKKSNDELKIEMIDHNMDKTLVKDKSNNHEGIIKETVLHTVKHLIKFTKELNTKHGR